MAMNKDMVDRMWHDWFMTDAHGVEIAVIQLFFNSCRTTRAVSFVMRHFTGLGE